MERREGELNIGDIGDIDDNNNDDNNNDDNNNDDNNNDDNNNDDNNNNNNDDDDNDATPPPTEEQQGDMVEIIIPRILAGGKTVEEAQGKAPSGVTVVSLNPDETFTLQLTEDRRMELVEEFRESTRQLCIGLLDDTPGVEDVKWNKDLMFEYVHIIHNADFEKEENSNTSNLALVRLLFAAPMVQVYSGAGLNTYSEVRWSVEDADEYWFIKSPETLYNMES